jgi:hypothetical protein
MRRAMSATLWSKIAHRAAHTGADIRQARLLDTTIPSTPRDLIPPVFEPQIVKMTDNQMTLHGYQIHVDAETGAIRHYAQP